jgi:hypothetical protein
MLCPAWGLYPILNLLELTSRIDVPWSTQITKFPKQFCKLRPCDWFCQIMVSLLLLTNIKIDKKVEIYSWSVSRWTPRPEALNRTMLCMKWLATSDQEKFLVRPSPICVIRPIGLPGPKDARDFRSRITTLAINPPLLLVAVVVCLMNRKWQVVCNNTSNKLYNIPNVRRSILHLLRNNCKDMFITYLEKLKIWYFLTTSSDFSFN